MSSRVRFAAARDISPNRCTVISVFARQDQAEAAIEQDEEAGVFECDEDLDVGLRAYHSHGFAWSAAYAGDHFDGEKP